MSKTIKKNFFAPLASGLGAMRRAAMMLLVMMLATKSAGSFFGHVGSFEPGYEFDALVIDDSDLNHDNYSLLHRLERYIYLGDDRQIVHRFCRGKEIMEPEIK